MSEKFDMSRICTAVNAENCKLKMFGYFANDIASIRQTVEKKKVCFRTIYTCLIAVLDESEEKRYSTDYGNFALFYPTDTILNKERY